MRTTDDKSSGCGSRVLGILGCAACSQPASGARLQARQSGLCQLLSRSERARANRYGHTPNDRLPRPGIKDRKPVCEYDQRSSGRSGLPQRTVRCVIHSAARLGRPLPFLLPAGEVMIEAARCRPLLPTSGPGSRRRTRVPESGSQPIDNLVLRHQSCGIRYLSWTEAGMARISSSALIASRVEGHFPSERETSGVRGDVAIVGAQLQPGPSDKWSFSSLRACRSVLSCRDVPH
jgi:hypothetical protein